VEVGTRGGHGEGFQGRGIEFEGVDYVFPYSGGGGCGAADHGNVGEFFFEEFEFFEGGAEVVA
jgi:hypothetical protein